jgi:chitodextrinase
MGKARHSSWSAEVLAVGFAIVALLPASAAVSATSGLVAAYGFEAGSGTIVADSSGNGNDGTVAHASWTSGAYGSGLRLDGSGVGAVVPDSPSLHLRHGMTLEAWVKPTAVSAGARDVAFKGDDDYYLQATTNQNGVPATGGDFTGSGSSQALGTSPLPVGAWSYVAATYDGSALRLFVNGDEVASVPEDGTLKSSANALMLGGHDTLGQYFEGILDEVRVYDMARGADGIRTDMRTPVVPGTPGDVVPPSAPGPLAASASGSDAIGLSWGAASDNVGVSGYEVFRCQGDGCSDFARVAQVDGAARGYDDGGLSAGTTYSYRVRAVDAAGNVGDFSNTATATTTAVGDTDPPSAPGTLSASPVGGGEVDLSWGAASDASSVIYELQRCEGSGCTDFASVATVAATGYSDTSVLAATTYVYRVRAVDAAGNLGPFSNTAEVTTATTSSAGPGPLSVDPTGRYLVDQNGKPFLMTGDSPQALIGDLTESDAERYFADRHAKGFNTVWINLLCNNYTGCRDDGATWDGVPPFTTPGDFSTPNEAYFAHVDRILRLAGQYGLIVVLDPAETGGWLSTMESNGVDKLRAYGQYLGRRYRDFPNIIWMHGNDFQNWGPSTDPYVLAVAEGIRDVDATHLQTVELNYTTSGSLDDPAWAPFIQLNASYTYFPTYDQVLKDYNRSDFLPTFMVEANYEFEQNSAPPGGTPQQLRRQEYWTMLSGATGQLYGNHYTWQFLCSNRDGAGNCDAGWPDYLDTPGQTQFGYVKQLFEGHRWYDLVPDQAHAVVTDGLGSYGTNDYVTAASTPDGKLAIAYMPSARTITVDLGRFSNPVTARWYDPAVGTFTTAGSYDNAGSQQFTTPGANADGADDWVLVLEAA